VTANAKGLKFSSSTMKRDTRIFLCNVLGTCGYEAIGCRPTGRRDCAKQRPQAARPDHPWDIMMPRRKGHPDVPQPQVG